MHSTYKGSLSFSTLEPEAGLKAAVKASPQQILDAIGASGLRGRGGAGFPTGVKWSLAAAAESNDKYVVCNADEGEPGTFKDRVLLADFADLVFEGMTLAARAVNAREGYLYLRAEYTYLRPHLENVLARRRELGLLGRGILGLEGFDFDIKVHMGAGAYVCGEETALLESLEGYRGEPRKRPPFPVDAGYMNRPSVVNNVETLAWAAAIMSKGPEWFKNEGTDKSAGRKVFSVSGDCTRPGVYELPLGVSVANLLKEVGGEDAKAVQIGGAAGLNVPRKDFDRIIAFEDLSTGGSIIVFGPQRDMLKVAHNFLEFFVDESCGQCTPCRMGNRKLLEGVEALMEGRLATGQMNELRKLGETMKLASKCGLGQTSPCAFMSIMDHFGEEILGRTMPSAA